MSEGDVWTLRYWPLAGRGEFIRLVFEEAGVAYKEENDPKILTELYKTNEKDQRDMDFQHCAPPVVIKGNFSLSQTPVICKFLGKKFDLYPQGEENEWHAEQLNITIHDYIAEGRLAFHGLNHTMTYYKQVEETKPYIRTFVSERLPKFLRYFNQVLLSNQEGKGFLFGDSLTYVDLALLHVLRATEFQFPDAWSGVVTRDFSPLVAFKTRLEQRPRLSAYFKSDRCRPFEGNSMM